MAALRRNAHADADPPPDISWFIPLSSVQIPDQPGWGDLNLFQLPSPAPKTENKKTHHLAPLAGRGAACLPSLPIDVITGHLGRWLARHRQSQDLVDWVIERGGIIHEVWRESLADDLDQEREPWRSFWSLLVDGAATPPCDHNRRDDFLVTTSIRKGEWPYGADAAILRAGGSWLHPKMRFPVREIEVPPKSLSDIVEFRLKLANDYLLSKVLERCSANEIRRGLAPLADALTSKLTDALELATRGNVVDAAEYTTASLPSLFEQADQHTSRTWTFLVYLVIEAARSLHEYEPEAAQLLSARWRYLASVRNLLIFKRLAVLALTEFELPSPGTAVHFLMSNDAEILWNLSTWPEVKTFLLTRAPHLAQNDKDRLVAALVSGPQRQHFPNFEGDDAKFQESAQYLQLRISAQFLEAGLSPPENLRKATEARYPRGTQEDKAKFPTSEGVQRVAPPTADDLLAKNPESICELLVGESDWDAGHRLADILNRDFELGLTVVRSLAARNASAGTWEIGLGELGKLKNSDEKRRTLGTLLDVALAYPDWLEGPGVRPVSRFLSLQADKLETEQKAEFLQLWDMTLTAAELGGRSAVVNPSSPVDEAINAPGGDLAEALVDHLFSRSPKTDSLLPEDLAERFNQLWRGESDTHRHARVILASRVLWLHRIDPEWARQTILAAMGADDEQALDLWYAMFWIGKWDIELVSDLQAALQSILERMHAGPEEFARRLSEWVASILVSAPETLADEQVTAFFRASNTETLHGVVSVFKQTLQDAEARSPNLWTDRIKTIFDQFWPADRVKNSPQLSGSLLRMAVAAREAFPSVISALSQKALILPGSADTFISILDGQGGDEQTYDDVAHHPDAVLLALNLSVDETLDYFYREKLDRLLNRIVAAAAQTANDPKMHRLRAIVARG